MIWCREFSRVLSRSRRASRREFNKGAIAPGTAVSAVSYTLGARTAQAQNAAAPERLMTVNVNGQTRRGDVTAHETLAMTPRYKLRLTRPNPGCDPRDGGACPGPIHHLPPHPSPPP